MEPRFLLNLVEVLDEFLPKECPASGFSRRDYLNFCDLLDHFRVALEAMVVED